MIVKMKFLTITGPKDDLDRMMDEYLSRYEIHLENALSELKTVRDLQPFNEANPYRELLAQAKSMVELLDGSLDRPEGSISMEEAVELIKQLNWQLEEKNSHRSDVTAKLGEVREKQKKLEPFRSLSFDTSRLQGFRFVKHRYGSIAKTYFREFEKYVYDDLETVFFKCKEDSETVWGIYFVPASEADRVDAIYASMHFERIHLSGDLQGSPDEYWSRLDEQEKELAAQETAISRSIAGELKNRRKELLLAVEKLEKLSENFEVRRLAACTREHHEMFYILCGWMSEKDAAAFKEETESDENVYCVTEDVDRSVDSPPPTKLKNSRLVRPFEMFTRMYGLPAYNELDPTLFIALTYALIFGAMFGDAGQGLLLAVGGFLLYRFKKQQLAAIVGYAGIFSTIFGFLYGSLFGFEDILPALWLRPASSEAMVNLPFVGKMNTIFVVTIVFGMALNLLVMVFHIINSLKAKETGDTWFDHNGFAGLVFYGAAVTVIILFMTGHSLPGGIVLALMFGVPLLLIALKEPLTNRLLKKKAETKNNAVMFVVQTFFELFEVLLSYFSNTLSFIRIGAFAVSHAAMMEVVMMLSGAESGSPNWIVVVFGNLLVCAMEGLIVGIQVLRLEYYELFSRFYKGTGRDFKSYTHPRSKHLSKEELS